MHRQNATTTVQSRTPNALIRLAPDHGSIVRLADEDRAEVLGFLKIRPVHTLVMTSFINDNGVESELNRGVFYGHRDDHGKLDGVALIGHTTLVEVRSDAALEALAACARKATTPIHMIMASGQDAERFWSYMGRLEAPRLTCTEALFEVGFPFAVPTTSRQLRAATMDWLIPVAEAQAEVAFSESGVDPLVSDREGFLKRVARRIEMGRVFIATEGETLVFKTDIIAETDEAIYLEGIYVAADHRGQGIGHECLASLALELLGRVEHISLLSNVNAASAHRTFIKAGFRQTDSCTTLFV